MTVVTSSKMFTGSVLTSLKDMNGRLVLSEQINAPTDRFELELGQAAKGTYLLEIQGSEQQGRLRIVVS